MISWNKFDSIRSPAESGTRRRDSQLLFDLKARSAADGTLFASHFIVDGLSLISNERFCFNEIERRVQKGTELLSGVGKKGEATGTVHKAKGEMIINVTGYRTRG